MTLRDTASSNVDAAERTTEVALYAQSAVPLAYRNPAVHASGAHSMRR